MYFPNTNLNYVGGDRYMTLGEHLGNWISFFRQALVSRKPTICVQAESYPVEVANNEVFDTWHSIYPTLRNASVINTMFYPAGNRFYSYRSVMEYAVQKPGSYVAIGLDMATQIRKFQQQPQQPIVLSAAALTVWNANQEFKNTIVKIAPQFHDSLNEQLAQNAQHTNVMQAGH